MIKPLISSIIAAIVFVIFAGCSSKSETQKISFTGEAQGTYYAITYFDADNRNFADEIDSLLKAFDQSVSLWVGESIISRVNRDDTTVVLDDIFKYNFYLSKEISALSDGYFDFTVSPLVEAWGFSFKQKQKMSPMQIDSLRQLVDYRKVQISNGQVVKEDPRMRFDFNAIAQGYSVDLIAQFLSRKGIKNFVVDVGGEIYALGTKPDNEPWRVGVEHPAPDMDAERTIQLVVRLDGKGLATSGSYRKYYEENGKRYSHFIDPKTGYPVQHNLLSVTVLAKNAAEADALATAFMVMGKEKSTALLSALHDVEAFFIFWGEAGDYETYATPGFAALIEE